MESKFKGPMVQKTCSLQQIHIEPCIEIQGVHLMLLIVDLTNCMRLIKGSNIPIWETYCGTSIHDGNQLKTDDAVFQLFLTPFI